MFKTADSIALIFFTGFIMLLFNPKLLNDVGFQLSFLVTGGLITCIEPVCAKFKALDKSYKSKFFKKSVRIFRPIFLTAFSIGIAMASTIPNLINPEHIEFAAAYCLFSFSVFGVEIIAKGRIARDKNKDVPA